MTKLPQFDAGTAGIKVKPHFTGFVTEVEAELQRYDFDLDIRIGADTRVAASEIANLQRAARETQTFRMGADTRVAAGEIENLQRVARENQSFRADVDTAVARAKLAALKQMGGSIPFNAEMSGNAAANARSGLAKLKRGLGAAAVVNLSVGAVLGAGAAIAQLTQLAAAVAKVGQVSALAPAGVFAGLAGGAAAATGLSGIPAAFKAMKAASDDASQSVAAQKNSLADVAEAQYQVQASNRGLSDAYKDASRSIRDMNADLEEQSLSARDASLSVEEAAKRLAAVNNDPTSDRTTRARAQLAFEQAQLRLRQQQTATQDLAEDTAEANRKGIEGSDQVVEARHAQTRAIEGLRRATEELGAGSASESKLKKALEDLSPQARRAVEDVRSLGPAWSDVRKSAQDALTEGIGPSIKTLAEQQLPNLRDGLSGINAAFNRGFKDVLKSLSSDKNKLDFRESLENTRSGFSNAMKAAAAFTDAMTKLTTVGTTFLPQLGQAVGDAADRFNKLIQRTAADGSLREWMQEGITATRQLFSILGNLGSVVGSVFRASDAGDTLRSIDSITEGWRRFLRSTAGQEKLKEYFREAREAGARLGEILEDFPEILRGVWEGFQTWAAIASPFLKLVTSAMSAQPLLVGAAVAAFVGFKTIGPIFAALRGGIRDTNTAVGRFQSQAGGFMSNLRGIATATGGVANVAGVGATNLGRFGSAVQQAGTHVGAINRMQQAYMNAAAGATTFGRTAGTAAAAMSGVRSAVSGASAALGGPWVIALIAATAGIAKFVSDSRAHEQRVNSMSASWRDLALAQGEMTRSLNASGGGTDEDNIAKMAGQVNQLNAAIEASAGNRTKWSEWRALTQAPWNDNISKENNIADQYKAAQEAIEKLGLSEQTIAAQLNGDGSWKELKAKLEGMGDGGKFAAKNYEWLRNEMVRVRDAARATTPGFVQLNDAVKILADTSSSGADRLNAMKSALDALSGKPVDAQKALADYNDQVRATADLAASFNPEEGVGTALVKDGQVDTATANGRRLFDTLLNIRDKTLEVAASGGDLEARLRSNAEQFAVLSGATQLETKDIEALAASVGLVPDRIRILADLKGATDTQAQLIAIVELIKANDGKPITIPTNLLTDEARRALAQWNVEVKTSAQNPNVFTIDANTAAARAEIDKFVQDPKTLVINVELAKFKGLKVSGSVVDLTPENAAGGRLPTTGPGTDKRDGFLGVDRATGAPRTWLDGGEWIINRDSSEKYGSELAAINAGNFPRMAEGGVVGGSSTPSIIDSMQQIVTARFPGMTLTSGQRNTNDYHGQGKAADFSNGSDSTPEMRALASYIASAFPQSLELIHQPFLRNIKNGSNVGDGLGVYGAQTMAEHRNHVHWAMATAPSVSGATPSTTSPVADATTGVTTQSVINPQAALPGKRTDKELQQLTGEAAVDTANSERNAVYANPASTDQDKVAADLKYQQAQNSLESSQKSSDSDDVPTLPGFLGKAGEILGMGILSGLGLEQSVLSPSGKYAGSIKKGYDWLNKDQKAPGAGGYAYTPKNLPSVVTTPAPDLSAPVDDLAVTGEAATEGATTGNTVVDAIKRAMAPAGWNVGRQWDSLYQLVDHESGFDPTAQNPTSTAYGAFQFLNDTWATVGGTKTSDPYLQGVYGQKYIAQRYGDPASAWSFWQAQSPHWYDQGGEASGIGVMFKNVLRPERVLNPSNTETFNSALPLLESINASAWDPNRISADAVAAPTAAMTGGGGHDFSVHLHDTRVADVNDLVDVAERRAHVRQVGVMAASPR
ncbi:hypothetical protein [Nocardia aurea]|uniref:aggregation-promoting factor C-terminal-like domain-containing protein n=1 Tax=Nocardia aurea TaxID=2144174 RepID=UPI0033A6DFF3